MASLSAPSELLANRILFYISSIADELSGFLYSYWPFVLFFGKLKMCCKYSIFFLFVYVVSIKLFLFFEIYTYKTCISLVQK